MMASFVDHLWQSIGFFGVAWLLATMLRPNSAVFRIWVWGIAGLKFVVPFAVLHSLGGWYGFPVRHNAIPPPAVLTDFVATWRPVAAPAQSFTASTWLLAAALVIALIVSAACVRRIHHELGVARYQRLTEEARTAVNWEDVPRGPGALKTAALMSVAALSLSIPFVAGALDDRLQRQAALAIDARSLSSASISMQVSAPAFGDVYHVNASSDRVVIRHINIQNLVALTYGIGEFEVFGGAMPWMSTPYYDVSVVGPIHSPGKFDPYSLREPMTRFLHEQYGVSIRINGACQEPCADYESIVVERLAWCSNLLGANSTCPK